MPTSRTRAELDRVVPVVAAVRAALPDVPISIDTTKPAVAEAALAAGADLVNDVWGVGPDDGLVRVAAAHAVPLVVMHNRAEPRYDDLVAGGRRGPAGGARAGGPSRRRLGAADRRPGLRLREDARAEPPDRPASWARSGRWAGRSCWARRASRRWAACWTCRSAIAWRRRWRRPRSGSPRARTSSASTTSAPTSVPPG